MLLQYPDPTLCLSSSTGFTNATIADNNDAVAFMLTVPKTGTLARVGFLTGFAGWTSSANISVRIETINAKLPSGTLYHASGTGMVTGPAGGTWYRPQINGATGIPVTKGDRIAVVLSCPTGSPNLTIVRKVSSYGNGYASISVATFTTAWSETGGDIVPFALEYSDDSCPNIGAVPLNIITQTNSFHAGSMGTTTGDECGLSLTLPFSGQTVGVRVSADLLGYPRFCLYSGTTLIATTGNIAQNSHFRSPQMTTHYWQTPVALSSGKTYIVTLQPYNITINTYLYEQRFERASYLEAVGLTPTDGQVSRVDLGAWEPVNSTRCPIMGLLFDQVDGGSSRQVSRLYGV